MMQNADRLASFAARSRLTKDEELNDERKRPDAGGGSHDSPKPVKGRSAAISNSRHCADPASPSHDF